MQLETRLQRKGKVQYTRKLQCSFETLYWVSYISLLLVTRIFYYMETKSLRLPVELGNRKLYFLACKQISLAVNCWHCNEAARYTHNSWLLKNWCCKYFATRHWKMVSVVIKAQWMLWIQRDKRLSVNQRQWRLTCYAINWPHRTGAGSLSVMKSQIEETGS